MSEEIKKIEIPELVTKLLNKIGLKSTDLEALKSHTEEEPVDLDALATKYKEEQSSLHKANNTGINDKEKKEIADGAYRKAKADINKLFGLGYSRSDVDALKWDDFKKEAKVKHESIISEKENATDEDLKKKYDIVLKASQEKDERLAEWEERYNTDLPAEKERAQKEIKQYKVDSILSNKLAGVQWANEAYKEDLTEVAKSYLKGNYVINEDLTLFGQDGTSAAKSIDGNTIYTNLDEAIAGLMSHKKWDKKSFAGEKTETIDIDGKPAVVTEKLSENAQKMLERNAGKTVDSMMG